MGKSRCAMNFNIFQELFAPFYVNPDTLGSAVDALLALVQLQFNKIPNASQCSMLESKIGQVIRKNQGGSHSDPHLRNAIG